METIVRQAEATTAEIIAEAPVQQADSISALSSVEMSFVGGGCLAVVFA
jgi:hypothetical protein